MLVEMSVRIINMMEAIANIRSELNADRMGVRANITFL